MQGKCPECDTTVTLDTEDEVGDIVTCGECNEDLEITGLDPVELDYVEQEDSVEDEDEY